MLDATGFRFRNYSHSIQACLMLAAAVFFVGCSSSNYENRTFFRKEYGVGTHGRKTWFDHLVEVDPGGLDVHVAKNYEQTAPLRIAVLPFSDRGSANFVVDKIPMTFRNSEQRANWAWTDGNRTRRALNGYLASREFIPANLIQIDAVLSAHGVDTRQKLDAVSPATLGEWLGVDAVVYGEVVHYEAYYAFLVSAWQVGADVRMVSTHTGEELYSAKGSRYSVDLRPAFDPIDVAVNSGLSLLELRDITLARAEDEDAREIALRIPSSPKLVSQLIELTYAGRGDAEQRYSSVDAHPLGISRVRFSSGF